VWYLTLSHGARAHHLDHRSLSLVRASNPKRWCVCGYIQTHAVSEREGVKDHFKCARSTAERGILSWAPLRSTRRQDTARARPPVVCAGLSCVAVLSALGSGPVCVWSGATFVHSPFSAHSWPLSCGRRFCLISSSRVCTPHTLEPQLVVKCGGGGGAHDFCQLLQQFTLSYTVRLCVDGP
jgi:hypothetical protein